MAVRIGRPLFAAALVGLGAVLFSAPGCTEEGIGDPCVPEQEYNETFLGFNEREVNVESKSFQCRTRLCLVHHFRGRVSCPYGQGPGGEAPTNGAPCFVPGTDRPIAGEKDPATQAFIDPRAQSTVLPQCLDRSADKAVYCSCRCAGLPGEDTSGQPLCECPDGFVCERLVTSIGSGNQGLTGSYCIKQGTKYDQTTACTQGDCDKNVKGKECDRE